MILTQRLLKFKLNKNKNPEKDFLSKSEKFITTMPYKQVPYSSRNWGHPWHSLCSYHGKLKPAIAHFLVKEFTQKGDVVVDPLCGVGTIPLEACLQGRVGIGNDLSELAYIVTKAKLQKPTYNDCLKVIDILEQYIESSKNSPITQAEILKYSSFGFNKNIPEYFHPDTYKEILCARRYFFPKTHNISSAEAMVFSCLLHVLHGNRPYALSRNSHPLTPYAPTGPYVYKNVIEHITNKLDLTYKKGEFADYCPGQAIFGDYEDLPQKNILADAIICSPPFVDSIRFYMQNWMRLWLCGWEDTDYKNAETVFIDQKQKKDFDIYKSFFKMCYKILRPNGKVILHLGKTKNIDMANELSKRAHPYFIETYRGEENVQMIEKHGIKDKGATVDHQFLFLIKS